MFFYNVNIFSFNFKKILFFSCIFTPLRLNCSVTHFVRSITRAILLAYEINFYLMTRYFCSTPFCSFSVRISLYYTKVIRVVCDLFSALVDSTGIVDPIALREPENLSSVNSAICQL